MAVTTASEFFKVLEKSNLLTPSQLVQAHNAAGGETDPRNIARTLARLELITRWQAGQLLAGRSSFYLGKYRLIELVGRGGLGNVFLGQHVTMNRRVALKTISRHVQQDGTSLDRFLAEARAIAALDHPNIVQAYAVDNEGDRFYLVMEYVDGIDLERLVEEDGPLDYDRAADYIRQAADGLAHAHERGMIHGSIRPSKLLVNVQGVVKILDMGMARLNEDEPADDELDDLAAGSLDYLAPEQASGSFDRRADIYSLGCTMYYLLAGHPPPPDELGDEPPSVREERPDVPEALDELCRRMIASGPEDRCQTAAEVSDAITEWRALMIASRRATPPLQRRRPQGSGPFDLATDSSGVGRRSTPKRGSGVLEEELAQFGSGPALQGPPDDWLFRSLHYWMFRTPWGVFAILLSAALLILAIAAAVVLSPNHDNTERDRHPPGASSTAS